jgi:hypothetical protein
LVGTRSGRRSVQEANREPAMMIPHAEDDLSVVFTMEIVVENHVHDVSPGAECPTCHRRVPFPRSEASPASKVVAYRVPTDGVDDHKAVIDAAARHLGVFESPYWRYRSIATGLILVLQGPPGGGGVF